MLPPLTRSKLEERSGRSLTIRDLSLLMLMEIPSFFKLPLMVGFQKLETLKISLMKTSKQ